MLTDDPINKYPHGSRSRYTHGGCRCDECKRAHNDYKLRAKTTNAKRQAALSSKGVYQNPKLVHGREATYSWHGCRCHQCIDAARKEWRERKAKYRIEG